MTSFTALVAIAVLVFAVASNAAIASDKVEDSCPPCKNTKEYWPVCGSDGHIYVNKGALQCASDCQKSKSLPEIFEVKYSDCEDQGIENNFINDY